MSLPSSSDLEDLSYPYNGQPYVRITNVSTLNTYDLSYPYNAFPLLAPAGQGSATLTDYIFLLDTGSGDLVGGADISPTIDSLSTSRSITFNEYMYLTDSVTAGTPTEDIEFNGSVLLRVLATDEFNGSAILKVKTPVDTFGSVTNNVLANNLVPVTSASGLGNPTETTVVVGGTTVQSFPDTIPPNGLANARCYVNFKCNSLIPGQQISNFYNWNINLSGARGTWKTTSVSDFGQMNDQLQIFGLTGALTQKGREKSTSVYGYMNGGIMGTAKLNKPVAFNYAGGTQYTTMMQNQSLLLPDPSNWKTYADATRQIASNTDVSVNWAVPDYPLSDLSWQSGMTSIEALEALAEGVGAKLRWNGSTEYTVLFPNKPIGTYEVPDCCLIQSLSNTCYLDIKTGIYNPGLYVFPQYPLFNAGVSTQPQDPSQDRPPASGSFERNVEVLFTSSKLLTPNDPAFSIDLPADFEDIFIKIVTVTDGGGIYVTTNTKRWFLMQTGFAGQYINYNDVLGNLQPQITIDWTLFPQTNSDVLNGNFIFMIGISRKNFGGSVDDSQNIANQEIKQNLAKTWLKFRFIPTCQYNVTAVFSGAIPLLGMALKATIGDYIVGANNDVIIEDVSFGNPGILNITAIQWSEIQYYDYLRGLP